MALLIPPEKNSVYIYIFYRLSPSLLLCALVVYIALISLTLCNAIRAADSSSPRCPGVRRIFAKEVASWRLGRVAEKEGGWYERDRKRKTTTTYSTYPLTLHIIL